MIRIAAAIILALSLAGCGPVTTDEQDASAECHRFANPNTRDICKLNYMNNAQQGRNAQWSAIGTGMAHLRILGEQIERARHVDPAALTGFELALQALALALSPNRSRAVNSSDDAVELLDQAMTLAPDCGLAVALSGWCHARSANLTWSTNATQERAKAGLMADRAGILAPADAMVLAIRASITHLAGEYEAAESLATRAVAIDPTCAWGWDRLGWVHEAANRPDEALPFFARAERFSVPYLDKAASLDGVGTAYFTVGRYEVAAVLLKAAALIRPGSTGLHGKLAACYAQLGDKPAARAELAKLRGILPDVSATQYVSGYPCSLGPFKDVLANSLTSIGMPA